MADQPNVYWDSLAKTFADGLPGNANAGSAATGGGNPFATYLSPVSGDNTAAIAAAISNAVAAAVTRGDNYAEVWFAPGVYQITSAPSGGKSGYCNAQIPIDPIVIDSGFTGYSPAQQKVTLALRGIANGSALYHWHQTVPQEGGVVFHSTYNPGTSVSLGNEWSVIGGPTPHFYTASNFSNMHIVIDGIVITVPEQPQIGGFDFRQIAEMTVISAAVLARSTGTGAPAVPTLSLPAVNDWSFGLWTPNVNNNALCDIEAFSAEGIVYGLNATEHVRCSSLRVVNCFDGLTLNSPSGAPHGNVFDYVCAENNVHHVVSTNTFNHVQIKMLDVEATANSATPLIVDNAAIAAEGTIVVHTNGTAAQLNANILNNASMKSTAIGNLRIINGQQGGGHQASPTVPATTVALQNPFWRDAWVIVSGGTVTAITVDGTATGFTSGAVLVPTCKTIAITYSVVPTWTWWLI